jgi:hypothetical protein
MVIDLVVIRVAVVLEEAVIQVAMVPSVLVVVQVAMVPLLLAVQVVMDPSVLVAVVQEEAIIRQRT